MTAPTTEHHTDRLKHLAERAVRARWPRVVSVLVAGLALSLFLFQALRRAESNRIALDFRRDASDTVSAFKVSLTHGTDAVTALDALYSSTPDVGRAAFRAFTAEHLLEEPGVLFLGWAPLVAHTDRADFERSVRSETAADPELAAVLNRFRIFEAEAGSPEPAAPRSEYFPMLHAEPPSTRNTLGLDLASDPVQREALTRARVADRMAVTQRARLKPDAGNEFGVVAFNPVSVGTGPVESRDERTAALRGFAVGMFEVGAILERAMDTLQPRGIDVVIHDRSAVPSESLLYYRESRLRPGGTGSWTVEEALESTGLALAETIRVGDRQWLIACRPAVGYVSSRQTWTPFVALVAGMLLSGGFAVILFTTLRRELETSRFARQLLSAKQELLHAQKMEAIGRLAGGVAHDFNNLLQVVTGSCDLLLDGKRGSADREEMLREIRKQAERGTQLARRLLVFSRRETYAPAPIDLGEVIRDAETLVRRLLKENIDLALEPADAPLPIAGDAGQLEQVLMNLVVNAADAMAEGGRLEIRCGTEGTSEVWFSVCDTGPGIAAEMIDRVFDPYFTTKSAAQGTGLGLAVVDGIVSLHKGRVEVDNRPHEGVEFKVVLPRSERRESEVAPAKPPPGVASRGAGERVLVVEDQYPVRQIIETMLNSLGYEVTTASDGAAARQRAAQAEFDLLVSDIVLPDTTGVELAIELRTWSSTLAVLLVSGYAADSVRERAAGFRFLQKPFRLEDLAQQTTAALQERSARAD